MKRTGKLLLNLAAVLLVGALLLLGIFRLAGVRNLYLNHVIATFEFTGIPSADAAGTLERQFQQIPGLREAKLARAAWAEGVWLARVQFRAPTLQAGDTRLRQVLDSLRLTQPSRLVKATFYHCRLSRPAHGDIVLGAVHQLPLRP